MNGVAYSPKTGRWRAWIRLNNRPVLVGYFPTEDQAKRERDVAAVRHGQTEQLFYPEDRERSAELAKGRRYPITGSVYRGVEYDWVNEVYWAKPKAWGKVQRKIGPFPSTHEGARNAALAADRYAYKYGASTANLNFPGEFVGRGRRTGRIIADSVTTMGTVAETPVSEMPEPPLSSKPGFAEQFTNWVMGITSKSPAGSKS